MRIHAFVRSVNERSGGGSHHNFLAQVRYLQSRGHHVSVHALTRDSNAKDLTIIEHDTVGLSFRNFNGALVSLLKKHESEADIFFIYGPSLTWGAGMYKMNGGKTPVVVYLDNYLDSMRLSGRGEGSASAQVRASLHRIKQYLWEKGVGLRYAQCIDRFVAVSPFVEEVYMRHGFPKHRFSVIPNFFDVSSILSVTHQPQTRLRVLYTGRISYDKGSDVLCEAASVLAQEYDFELRVVGDGPQRESLEQRLRCGELPKNISILPWVDPAVLAREYAEADIFVHPARWPEPFGRTIVEAMAYGVPVIVPEHGAAAWIAQDAGLTFKNGSRRALAGCLRKLMGDAVMRRELARKGRERASHFDASIIAPRLERLLEKLAATLS